MATGDEIEAGKNTGANHTTRLVGERTYPAGTATFIGDEILEVVPLPEPAVRTPGRMLDGLVGSGWNGTLESSVGNPTGIRRNRSAPAWSAEAA